MNKLSLFLRLCACVCARVSFLSPSLYPPYFARVLSFSLQTRGNEREREREKRFGVFEKRKRKTLDNFLRKKEKRKKYTGKQIIDTDTDTQETSRFLSFFLSFFLSREETRASCLFLSLFLARPSSSSFVVVGTESESSSRGARRWRRRGSHVETRPYFCSFALRLVCRPLRDAGRARRCRCRGRVVSSPERDRKREDCNLSTTFEWFFLSTRSVATKRRRKRKKRKRHL